MPYYIDPVKKHKDDASAISAICVGLLFGLVVGICIICSGVTDIAYSKAQYQYQPTIYRDLEKLTPEQRAEINRLSLEADLQRLEIY